MKHLGDISKINGAEIEPVDIITFGSPCQDLSVAGKRAGLDGTRSGLFMEAVRIIREMREATNGQYPTFALWENVPGAFSSNKGEDFRIVLEELIKIAEPSAAMPEVPPFGWAYADSYSGDGWSLAYRVFDAQYWGVPQRRRRIHLVADFRGQRARQVLFEREGLRGDITESPAPRKETPTYVKGGSGAADQIMTYAVATQQGGAEISENGICPTVTAAAGMSGNNQPWVMYWDGSQTVGTLTANNANGSQRMPDKDHFNCVISLDHPPKTFQNTGQGWWNESPVGQTLRTPCGGDSVKANLVVLGDTRYIVRRLTPTECARLQGFADKWGHPEQKKAFTDAEYLYWLDVRNTHAAINSKAVKEYTKDQMLKWYNKLHSDSAEYKMWGNGIALPPALYCMLGISEALEKQHQYEGSL